MVHPVVLVWDFVQDLRGEGHGSRLGNQRSNTPSDRRGAFRHVLLVTPTSLCKIIGRVGGDSWCLVVDSTTHSPTGGVHTPSLSGRRTRSSPGTSVRTPAPPVPTPVSPVHTPAPSVCTPVRVPRPGRHREVPRRDGHVGEESPGDR